MQDIKHIETSLNEICNHALFANSPIPSGLLKYLVEKALKKEDVNEYTIGTELYGIDYAEDKNNGTVRSYMYKLRKKLATYYTSIESPNIIFFFIEKGQYNLSFNTTNKYKASNKASKGDITIPIKWLKLVGVATVLIFLVSGVVHMLLNKPNIIWKPFFENNTMVVISDQYILNYINQHSENHATIYKNVNSDRDFLDYAAQYPDRKISATDYTLLSKMGPYSIKLLSKWFYSKDSDFTLNLESTLTYDDIRDHHIIFIGQYKTMNISSSLFLKDSKVFTTFKDGFKYKNNNVEKIYNTKHEKNGKVEYAMISCTSISHDKKAIYFVSNNDIGVIATVRQFTNDKWLNEFNKKLPKNACHFNALFEVSGLQRTDVSCKMVELEILN